MIDTLKVHVSRRSDWYGVLHKKPEEQGLRKEEQNHQSKFYAEAVSKSVQVPTFIIFLKKGHKMVRKRTNSKIW